MAASARARRLRRRRPSAIHLVLGAAVSAAIALAGAAPASADGVPSAEAGAASPEYYRVQPGDGFYAIANMLGVSTDALLARNGLTIDFVLHPGYVLIVPEGGYVPPPSAETTAPSAANDSGGDAGTQDDSAGSTSESQSAQSTGSDAPASAPSSGGGGSGPADATSPPATSPPAADPPPTTAPPMTAPPTTAAPAPAPSGVSDCRVGGIGWINNARANAGVAQIGQGGSSAACAHSRRQAEADSMFHSGSGCGEIVGYSSRSPDDLPGAWLNSQAHYNIIVSPHASSAAVAYVQNLSTGYWYGTGVFC